MSFGFCRNVSVLYCIITQARLAELCDHSFCHSVSRITRERVDGHPTKHGIHRHGQWVTLSRHLIFGVDPDLDVDLGSLFHFPYHSEIGILCDILLLT